MVAKRKTPWYPLKGHHGGKQKDALVPTGGAPRWQTERRPGTHWRGTTVANRKTPWYPIAGHHGGKEKDALYPLKGHHGGKEKDVLVPTGGAPWWQTEIRPGTHWRGTTVVNKEFRPEPGTKTSPRSLWLFPVLTEISQLTIYSTYGHTAARK